jgi:hypothetical protein
VLLFIYVLIFFFNSISPLYNLTYVLISLFCEGDESYPIFNTILLLLLPYTTLHRFNQRPRQYKMGDSLEPDVYFKPVQVWEVRAADLSLSSTHKGGLGKPGIEVGRGIGLRFPRFLRERTDKPPTLATSSEQIRDLYFDQQGVANTTNAAADDYDEDDELI